MKIGLVVPVTYRDPADAADLARRADTAGVDGVFAVDHLSWHGKPVLSHVPLLTLLAATTSTTRVGSLVMRVGVRPLAMAVRELATIQEISRGRLIAGLGVGDASSHAENALYGIETPPFEARLQILAAHCTALTDESIEVWAGGRSPGVMQVAAEHGVAVNLWQASQAEVVAAGRSGEVTWAGKLDNDPSQAADCAVQLKNAGVTWMVVLAGGDKTPAEAVSVTVGLQEALRR